MPRIAIAIINSSRVNPLRYFISISFIEDLTLTAAERHDTPKETGRRFRVMAGSLAGRL
jgi:hypothetical protein